MTNENRLAVRRSELMQFRYYVDKAIMEGYWDELRTNWEIPNKIELLTEWEINLIENKREKEFENNVLEVMNKIHLNPCYLSQFIEALKLPQIYSQETKQIEIKYDAIPNQPTIWIGIYDTTTIRDLKEVWPKIIAHKKEVNGKRSKISQGRYPQSIMFRLKREGKTNEEIATHIEKLKENKTIDSDYSINPLIVSKRISEYKAFLHKR